MTSTTHALFPTPVMIAPEILDNAQIAQIKTDISRMDFASNAKSSALAHSSLDMGPLNPILQKALIPVQDKLVAFGRELFGEELNWTIKEAWVNILETGGHQAMHLHANSFISGVVYLTDSHPSANLMFQKPESHTSFVFSNFNARSELNPFTDARWQVPDIKAGDLILFPSYMMHGVAGNEGEQRISLAFNAIPDKLDSWGYSIRFNPD